MRLPAGEKSLFLGWQWRSVARAESTEFEFCQANQPLYWQRTVTIARTIFISEKPHEKVLSRFIIGLTKVCQAYDKSIWAVPNSSLQGSKFQFGQRKTIIWTKENWLISYVVCVSSSPSLLPCNIAIDLSPYGRRPNGCHPKNKLLSPEEDAKSPIPSVLFFHKGGEV